MNTSPHPNAQRRTAPTGSGVLGFTGNGEYVETYRPVTRQDAGSDAERANVEHISLVAQEVTRAYVMRIVAVFMFAAGALSAAAFLALPLNDKEKWPTALGAVINLIAAWHYKRLADLREQHDPQSKKWEMVNSSVDQHAVQEFYVDGVRFSDWTVTLPLLVLKLYAYIGRSYNGEAAGPGNEYHGIHVGPETAAWLAALMIGLGAFVRLGTDDFAEWRVLTGGFNCGSGTVLCWNLFGLVALLGSCAIFVLLELELFLASDGIPDHVLFRSFFLIWVGYPIVFIGCILWRIDKTEEAGTGGLFHPRLSVAKDLLYAMLDVWSKGVFAMWSVHTAFGALPYYGASGIASKEF